MLKPSIRKILGYSLNEAERFFHLGIISYSDFVGFQYIWEWSAPRMGGIPGVKHDQFWNKFGAEKYYLKINKVRKACGFEPLTN